MDRQNYRRFIINDIEYRINWNINDFEPPNVIIDFLQNMHIDNDNLKKELNFIKKIIYKESAKLQCETECSICLIKLDNKKRIISQLNCDHLFHKTCINKWFKQKYTCPNCRK